jgi:hypothetical protein
MWALWRIFSTAIKPGVTDNGDLVRRNGFPENFFVLNPQFATITLHGNPGNSTYHSLQLQLTKRLSQGFTDSMAYTWSRTLGESDGDGDIAYRDPNNRSASKQLLGFHRTHAITNNGTYDLPFDRTGIAFERSSWVSRLVRKTGSFGESRWTSDNRSR